MGVGKLLPPKSNLIKSPATAPLVPRGTLTINPAVSRSEERRVGKVGEVGVLVAVGTTVSNVKVRIGEAAPMFPATSSMRAVTDFEPSAPNCPVATVKSA